MADAPLSLLWLIDFDPRAGMQHGGALRWFNYSRELISRGHRVCFSVNRGTAAPDTDDVRAFLDRLRAEGRLSGWGETHYGFPRRLGKGAHLLAHPGLTNRVLGRFQEEATAAVEDLVAVNRADAVVISDRLLLFLTPRLRPRVPVVVDWCDSFTLYYQRQAAVHWKERAWRPLLQAVKRLAQSALQERYYGRRSDANVLVSPVDLHVFERVVGRRGVGRLVPNGTEMATESSRLDKTPGRLIFTGAMGFPPNFEAAIWFIDRVLPLVVSRRPDVQFVVAGRDPVADLVRRAGPHVVVTGPVPDMREEIARSALYVAPLVSGGGFKNKVIEALASGTYVAGTSLAVEFLPDDIRRSLLVGDTPAALAEQVLTYLRDPVPFMTRLPSIVKAFAEEYTWARRAEVLELVIREAMRRGRG